MRRVCAFLAGLSACAAPGVSEPPADPAALRALLGSPDPRRREEAAHRLSLAGRTVDEALASDGCPPEAEAACRGDTESIAAGIARALEERDPQRMVWRAYHAVRAGCLGREWRRLSDALSRQGFRLSEVYEPDDRAKFVRFPARAAAYENLAGDKHDLFFWVRAARAEERWVVREVYVGLHASFDVPFKTLAAAGRYPPGSMPARFFALPEVRTLAGAFPLLEEIELTYGRIRGKESGAAAAGFHLNAGFATAGEGRAGGRGVYYTAECGLDPLEARSGRLLWDEFRPTEALGPLVARGSGFWGAGGLRPADD